MQPFLCFCHHIGKTNIMKKLILLSLFLPLFATAQTIPNGNFESWFTVGSLENPESWETDNTESYITVSKDTAAYEGNYAMRVTAQPTGVVSGEYGEAYTFFDINYIPSALNFYAKYYSEAGGSSVEISFFNANEDEIYTEYWSSGESMEDYTLVSIPLTPFVTPEDPPPITARVRVSALVGDFAPGHAWISVDAMTIGMPQSIKGLERVDFEIYPNPASEKITIQSSQDVIGNFKIFDVQGKMVFEKRISETSVDIDIRKFSPGVYTLRSDNMNVRAATFIVK